MGKSKVVLFSGGSGTASIARALVDQGVDLTLVVNRYDDGLSTGELRKAIGGMLGPSDVRKNVARFCFTSELGVLLESRVTLTEEVVEQYARDLDNPALSSWLRHAVAHGLLGMLSGDCPLGNLVFAGCYLSDGKKQFNLSVTLFQEACACECLVLNVTQGENLQLRACAVEGFANLVWMSEAEICTRGVEHPIALLEFQAGHRPTLNPDVALALLRADLIVYGPGTQHSSLLPSYLTNGLAECIAPLSVPKVYIANLMRDRDIAPNETFENVAKKMVVCMSRYGQFPVTWAELVTHTMIDKSSWAAEAWVPSIGKTYLGRFGGVGGKHHGALVAQHLLSLATVPGSNVKTRPNVSKRQSASS